MSASTKGGVASAAPSRILVFDPGDITGWMTLVKQRDGSWKSFAHGQFGEDANFVRHMIENRKEVDVVIVEETPMGKGTPRQRDVIQKVYEHGERNGKRVIHTYPGSWKPWAKARGVTEEAKDVVTGGMRHARDAYCMARYVIEMEGF